VRGGAVLVVAAGPWRRVGVDGAALRAQERERERVANEVAEELK
jgi:hypothetical protein